MNIESIVAYYNGLPEHFKWEGVFMVLNPYAATLNNIIDNTNKWKKQSIWIDLISREHYDIPHHPIWDLEDVDHINLLSSYSRVCFKKMYDMILSWDIYIDTNRGKWDLIWYKWVLFLVPFKVIPTHFEYEPIELFTKYWFWRKETLVRIKIYKYEHVRNYISSIKKNFKRKWYIKNDWYLVETLAITDGSVSATYLRPVTSIDNIENHTWLFYTQHRNILYIDYERSFNSDCINDMMNEFPDFTSFDEE